MAGRILILDSVATNRIVLKVKMAAAQYDVESCATHIEAKAFISSQKPDLLLINMADPVEDRYAFCRSLRAHPETASIGIICVGVADTSRARFAALDCGADDVLPRPIGDALMMARIRSLLRQRNVGLEWQLRDGTRRALGFEESAAPLLKPAKALIVSNGTEIPHALHQRINRALRQNVRVVPPLDGLKDMDGGDLLIIDGTQARTDPTRLFQMIADLQSRFSSKQAAQMVILPSELEDVAAMCFDLGAEDVAFDTVRADELQLRLNALSNRKARRDQMNSTVRDGLNAAVTDPLTGLYNRRYADMHLVQIAKQARQTGHDYSVMLLDIDHFKLINDTHGHSAGDEVLKDLAQRLRANLRPVDLLARVGGEEFLIVMPDTSDKRARLTADRLRRLVNDAPFHVSSTSIALPVTISVGVAVDRISDPTPHSSQDLINRADEALYCAKSAGRNMVSMSRTTATAA